MSAVAFQTNAFQGNAFQALPPPVTGNYRGWGHDNVGGGNKAQKRKQQSPDKKGLFQFGKRRSGKIEVNPRPLDKPEKDAEDVVELVQGKTPGSIQEYRVAVALNRLKFEYIFQYEIEGGRSVRGGQVIDFWVYTAPLPTPVYVQGDYWHGARASEDAIKQSSLKLITRGQAAEALLVWEHELTSMDAAYETMKARLIG